MKKALITGAYGVIGRAISEMMAEKNYALILVGRDANKMEKVCNEIKQSTGNNNISGFGVDLSRESSIRSFCNQLNTDIDVLINNAATTPVERLETPEGIELQWATNVLGYIWMTHYISPKIKQGGRIVDVASFYAGGLDMSDVEFKRRSYDNDTAYRQSKQANRMISVYFADKLKDKNITVNSCHPGEISSKLSNNLGFFFPDPPRVGADTPVWLATDPSLEGITGKYFQYRKELPCSFSNNPDQNQKLYELCKSYFE